MHPSSAGLIAFCDAEAGSVRRRLIARHLSKCENCRDELRRIQTEKDHLSMSETPPAGGDLQPALAALRSSMAAWREGRTVVLASEVKSRVRAQLETYLGAPAVPLIERPGMRAEELLANAGEMLDALLGPKAAAAVRDDVLSGLDCAGAAAETLP
jgi:hypothetical protein